MRAAAPSALSGSLRRSDGKTAGQHSGITPPVKALAGLRLLLSSWPSCDLQIFSLHASFCSCVGHKNDQRLRGAAAGAAPVAVAGRGATGLASPGPGAGVAAGNPAAGVIAG